MAISLIKVYTFVIRYLRCSFQMKREDHEEVIRSSCADLCVAAGDDGVRKYLACYKFDAGYVSGALRDE